MSYFKHESAYVDEGAIIGEGTRIWHFSHIAPGARLGRGCTIGQGVYIAPTAVLGEGVRVQNNVSIYDGVVLEDHVFVGPSAVFTNVVNPRSEVSRKHEYRQTWVRRGATIGANATIVCGHEIGAYAFIGAGAVVTSNVPAYALCMGVPARQRGWMCRCGERLRVERGASWCSSCGRGYRLEEEVLCEA
ncbi:MAG: acyltransferase [Myxococcales bacterium]|nr:N-acetyltransferase [Myxococcota bacterium]MDW8281050.1 acyltransferase [Myxococcales bacterium]